MDSNSKRENDNKRDKGEGSSDPGNDNNKQKIQPLKVPEDAPGGDESTNTMIVEPPSQTEMQLIQDEKDDTQINQDAVKTEIRGALSDSQLFLIKEELERFRPIDTKKTIKPQNSSDPGTLENLENNFVYTEDIKSTTTPKEYKTSISVEEVKRLKALDPRKTVKTEVPSDSQTELPLEPPTLEIKESPDIHQYELWGGRYKIIREIGRGGMGVVYLAKDMTLHRTVALKVLLEGIRISKDDRVRFRREAQMAASLSHPNIVSVYDIGTSDKGLYFTMEYIEGKTLHELIKEEGEALQVDFIRITSILESILDGISYAHRGGVLHRDMKPGNIIISHEKVKIMDFGLARSIKPEEPLTHTGAFIGTPAYDSPEQIQARHGEIDHRCDLYSIGIILYEMLSGNVPFKGPGFAELAKAIVYDDPPSPKKFNSLIPKDLETICLKAIEKDPKHRYQSAEEFLYDIRCFKNGHPIKASPSTMKVRVFKLMRRHKVASISLLVALFISISSISAIFVESYKERQRQIKDYFERCQRALERKEFHDVYQWAAELKKLDPENKEVDELLKTAKERAYKMAQNLLDEGRSLISQKDWSGAVAKLMEAKRFLPDDPEIERFLEFAKGGVRPVEIKTRPVGCQVLLYRVDEESLKIEKTPFAIDDKSPVAITPIEIFLPLGVYLVHIEKQGYVYARTRIVLERTKDPSPFSVFIPIPAAIKVPPGMIYIPGGDVVLGGRHLSLSAMERKTLNVGPFLIDRTEVTNEMYKNFLDATGAQAPKHWNNGQIPLGKENYPVTNINWEEASSYAKWAKKRLPTTEEWEKAARWLDERPYPWGNGLSKGLAIIERPIDKTAAVGFLDTDESPYGVRDMAGNVSEWTSNPAGRNSYILRGASFASSFDSPKLLTLVNQISMKASFHYEWIGFRCAKDVDFD